MIALSRTLSARIDDSRTFELPRLADFECKHGRLSGDSSKPCGCYPSEPTPRRRNRKRATS